MMKKVLYGVALALLASVSVGSLQSCKDDLNDVKTQTSYDLTKLNSDLLAKLQGLSDDTAEALRLKADITWVQGKIDALDAAYKAADDALKTSLESQIQAGLDRIGVIEGRLPEGEIVDKDYVDGQIELLKTELEALVNEGDEGLEALIRDTQESLTQLINLHNADLEEVKEQIQQIMDAIDSIVERIDKQVTGILIQGVNSPVFGDFRTPLGIKSNILFNWYGYNSLNKDVEFPSKDVLPAALNPEPWTAASGFFGDDAENVTLGKVYVTLNPVGAKFDNIELSIENSAGVALPYTVTLSPSDYELQHGYSRSEANGFYEGEVKMELNEDNVNQIKVNIEDDLKTSMKDVLKDPSRTTAKALVKAVLEQLQGKIPAYGLRYSWMPGLVDEDETDPGFGVNSYAAVLSQYDLAVATAHPLSYNFLAGYEGSRKLPEIGHIDNLILKLKEDGDLQFKFDEISFDEIKIKLPEITITTTEVKPGDTKVTAEVGEVIVYDKDNKEVGRSKPTPVTVNNVDKIVDDLAAQINKSISEITSSVADWSEKADKSISDQLQEELGKVAKQINDMMDSINGQIDNMITNLGNKFQPYFDKVNKAIDLYNKIANKLNNFLADPNAYLQVAAFYSMGGTNYGIVSGKASDPTPFVGNGEAFNIFLSSYTGELIVPACKKYVAITAAPAGVDLAAINTGDLNKVLDGNQIEVKVAKPTVKGVYEFTYQAIDYSGYTSTKKFYIEVK